MEMESPSLVYWSIKDSCLAATVATPKVYMEPHK